MTVAFTSIIGIFIIERIDEQKGTVSLLPLLLAGVVSIMYWRYYATSFMLPIVILLILLYTLSYGRFELGYHDMFSAYINGITSFYTKRS